MYQYLMKSNFAGGEWGAGLYSAYEVSRYPTACRKMHNAYCRPHGTVTNRPGLEYIDSVHATSGMSG